MDTAEMEMLHEEKNITIYFYILKMSFIFLYQFSEFCVDNYILF